MRRPENCSPVKHLHVIPIMRCDLLLRDVTLILQPVGIGGPSWIPAACCRSLDPVAGWLLFGPDLRPGSATCRFRCVPGASRSSPRLLLFVTRDANSASSSVIRCSAWSSSSWVRCQPSRISFTPSAGIDGVSFRDGWALRFFLFARYRRARSASDSALPVAGRPRPRFGCSRGGLGFACLLGRSWLRLHAGWACGNYT